MARPKRARRSGYRYAAVLAKGAYEVGKAYRKRSKKDKDEPKSVKGKGEGSGPTKFRQARSGAVLKEGAKRKKKSKHLNLRQKVAKLEKTVNAEIKQIYSHTETTLLSSGVSTTGKNTCNYFSFSCGGEADFDNMMTGVQQVTINTADGTAIKTADFRLIDGSLGIKSRQTKKVQFRNNSCFPLKATFYELSIKLSTSKSPVQAIFDGLLDRGITATAANMLSYWPTDSPIFNEAYKIQQKEAVYMNPGDEFAMTVRTGWQIYNVDVKDHAVRHAYDKDLNTRFIMVRLEGVIVHDATTDTDVGLGPATLDQVIYLTSEVKIPDEGNLRRAVFTNSLSTVAVPEICGPNNSDQGS